MREKGPELTRWRKRLLPEYMPSQQIMHSPYCGDNSPHHRTGAHEVAAMGRFGTLCSHKPPLLHTPYALCSDVAVSRSPVSVLTSLSSTSSTVQQHKLTLDSSQVADCGQGEGRVHFELALSSCHLTGEVVDLTFILTMILYILVFQSPD